MLESAAACLLRQGKLTLMDKVEKLLPTRLEDLCSRGNTAEKCSLSPFAACRLCHLPQTFLLCSSLLLGIPIVPVPHGIRPAKWLWTLREIDLQPPVTLSPQERSKQRMTACGALCAQYMTIRPSTKLYSGD